MTLGNIIDGWLNRLKITTPSKAKRDLFKNRLIICEANICGQLSKIGTCTVCGCPVAAKTQAPKERCPLGFW